MQIKATVIFFRLLFETNTIFNKAEPSKKQIPNSILQKSCFKKCRKMKEKIVAMKSFLANKFFRTAIL